MVDKEDFCICERGSKGRNICSCFSSDRHWCSICKKTIFMEPDTEEEKRKRKKFLSDCHSMDDIIIKSFLSESDWQKYKVAAPEEGSLAGALTGG